MNLTFTNHQVLLLYLVNLFTLIIFILLLISVKKDKKSWSKINDYLGSVTKTIDSVRYGDLTKKIEETDLPNSEELADSVNRMIETLSDREKMIGEYQNELNKQNKLLESVINSLSDGLVIIDSEYKILRVTKQVSEWLNVEGNKLVGKLISDYIVLPRGKVWEKLINTDIVINEDKSSNFMASSMELKHDDKKKRYIIIIKNVTDQKELENLKEDFVATLTHDLKVPIIAETNMLELFLNENFGKISEKQTVALKNMQSSNKELLELVQTVLDTYKFKGNVIRLYKENIMLKSFLTEIIQEMSPISKKTNNSLDLSLDRDIRVYADRMQLKRVIKNLIQNAISYGKPDSPIEITIGEIPKYIVIKVKDYGAGISEADIGKIFNKYYSAAKKFRKIGTGLGLYLAFQIMKAHHGDLTVESVQGEYTEFCIKIPAVSDSSLYYGE